MRFYFRRSKKLGPLRLNASRRGISPSLSVGKRGRPGVSLSRSGITLRLLRGLGFRL